MRQSTCLPALYYKSPGLGQTTKLYIYESSRHTTRTFGCLTTVMNPIEDPTLGVGDEAQMEEFKKMSFPHAGVSVLQTVAKRLVRLSISDIEKQRASCSYSQHLINQSKIDGEVQASPLLPTPPPVLDQAVYLVSGDGEGMLKILDDEKLEVVKQLQAHTGRIWWLEVRGYLCVTAGTDKTVKRK